MGEQRVRVDANPVAGNGHKRILVVEDDESITLGLQMNLEAEGYEVTVALDGQDGLEHARRSASTWCCST